MLNPGFKEDILSQLDLDKLGLELEKQINNSFSTVTGKRIIITGNGDSFIAGLCMEYLARTFHLDDVKAIGMGDAAFVEKYREDDILIVVSLGGMSGTSVEAIKKVRVAHGESIGITHNMEGLLAKNAHKVVEISRISKNRLTPHASDYHSSLLVLGLLLNKLTNKKYLDLSKVSAYVQKNLPQIMRGLSSKEIPYHQIERFVFLASDINYPTTLFGAAKFWESQGTLGIGGHLDEFGHGLHMTLSKKDLVVILPSSKFPESRITSICEGLKLAGINYLLVSEQDTLGVVESRLSIDPIDPHYFPYVHHLVVQWIVYFYVEARKLDVETGKGKLDSINFSELNKFLR